MEKKKKIFWHIDYLTSHKNFKPYGAYIINDANRVECIKAAEIQKSIPNIPGFGSSDCSCSSHLFYAGRQEKVLKQAEDYARASGTEILCTENPEAAVKDVDIVYTDVWASMGQESEAEERAHVFSNYQVNKQLLSMAKEDAIFMHPLPAHRGEEVTDDVMDSPQSVVFDQAENRMHAQKALLAQMLGDLER